MLDKFWDYSANAVVAPGKRHQREAYQPISQLSRE